MSSAHIPGTDRGGDAVKQAEQEVSIAEAEFNERLSGVSRAGATTLHRIRDAARPAVFGMALLGGALATLALVAVARSMRRKPYVIIKHANPSSRGGSTMRSALVSFGIVLARNAIMRTVSRALEQPDKPGPKAAPPNDNGAPPAPTPSNGSAD